MVLTSVLLAGCGNEEASTTKEEPKKEASEKKETKEKEIPKAPLTIEEVNQQPSGELVKNVEAKMLEAEKDELNDIIDNDIIPKFEQEIKTFVQENKEATPEEIYGYMVSLIGFGTYATASENMENFEPFFQGQSPNLPTGDDTVTDEEGNPIDVQNNAVILIDASSSMLGEISGQDKMTIAKEAVKEFAEQLPEEQNVSLLAYGHKGSSKEEDKELSCKGIEAVYDMKQYDDAEFEKALNGFAAVGYTPLAGAIQSAQELLKAYEGQEFSNTVYIVSDGIETCDGDPVAAAKSLIDSNIKAKVNIIGFDVDDKGQAQLKEVADAGEGQYATVNSKDELKKQIVEKWKPSLGTLAWAHMKGVHPWDHFAEMQRFDVDKDLYNWLANLESRLISKGVTYLRNEELLERETADAVGDVSSTMREMKSDYGWDVREKKFDEMEAEVDRIDQEIKEWKAQYEE